MLRQVAEPRLNCIKVSKGFLMLLKTLLSNLTAVTVSPVFSFIVDLTDAM